MFPLHQLNQTVLSQLGASIQRRPYAEGKTKSKNASTSASAHGRLIYKPRLPPQGRRIGESPSTKLEPQRLAENNVERHDLIQQLYKWKERLIKAVKSACNAMYTARRLIGSFSGLFVAVLVALWIDVVRVGVELYKEQQQLEAIGPRELVNKFPLWNFFTTVPADWLTTPTSIVSQVACNFAHIFPGHLINQIIYNSVIFAVLKKKLPSRYIVIAFVLGGFFAINIKDAAIYFGNPSSRLSVTQLSARLAYIQSQRHLPEEHKDGFDDKDQQDWRSLKEQELELREAIRNYSILASNSALDGVQSWRIKEQKSKRQLQTIVSQKKLIEEKKQLLLYINGALGSSASTTCLGMFSFPGLM